MTWTTTVRNDKAIHNGVTYRANNNGLIVSSFGGDKRFVETSREAAKAHAEVLAAGAL
jgi:hypothetical protein